MRKKLSLSLVAGLAAVICSTSNAQQMESPPFETVAGTSTSSITSCTSGCGVVEDMYNSPEAGTELSGVGRGGRLFNLLKPSDHAFSDFISPIAIPCSLKIHAISLRCERSTSTTAFQRQQVAVM